jgi:hypothetical protein
MNGHYARTPEPWSTPTDDRDLPTKCGVLRGQPVIGHP